MTGGIDEIEFVSGPLHSDRGQFHSNPPLALDVHLIEELIAHAAFFDGPSQF